MKQKLFIFDGTALAYRAHFAFIKNPLINSKGMHTSALYGVVSSFIKIYEEYQPENIAISFDRKEPTFRHEYFDSYKANRPSMPEELISQMNAIRDFFELAGIKEISIPGYEADDIIGSLAKKFCNQYDIIIVSGDKDFAQLVNEKIYLYDPKNNNFLREQDIEDKYSIKASQFIDYLALVGDSSDNIPGAKGIGPKTAVRLLNEYNSVEELYKNIEALPENKEKQKIIDSKESVFISKKLATILTDIDLNYVNEETIKFKFDYLRNTLDMLEEFELRNLKKSISNKLTVTNSDEIPEVIDENVLAENSNNCKFILINTIDQLKEVLNNCKSDCVAIDTETTSIEALNAEIVGISLCFEIDYSYYIPLGHTFAENLEIESTINILKNFLKNKTIIGHNIKYDMQVFDKYNLHLEDYYDNGQLIFDTMIAAYLLDPGKNEYSLDKCADRELAYKMTPISDLIGKGKKQISFAFVELEKACFYAAEDAYVTFALHNIYQERLINRHLLELFNKIEIPLIFVLSYMEKQGVYLNSKLLNNLKYEVSNQLEILINKIYDLAGEKFNINSTQQLSNILFEKLKIKPVKKTKTGLSTDIEVLEILAEEHEIARFMIEYRHLAKMQSTYIEALPQLINPITQRIHTSFNQTITSTGRLSSNNPNLQNIPIKTELGREIRKAFSASENDKQILSADYSQIELRLLAMFSKDDTMVQAFKNGIDIHSSTASIIFKKNPAEINSDERRKAKVINFGIIYGMGAQKLAKELSISNIEAKDFIEDYFKNFPTIKSYMDKQVFNAHQNSWVETIYNRKLYLTDINSSNKRLVSDAERVAVNMPIQGSAADIIKIAMINIYKKIKRRDDIKMLIQVHDELVFEVAKDSLTEAADIIKTEMENALCEEYLKIFPLIAEVGFGNNWDEAH